MAQPILSGEVAVVTGGGRGIGMAAAEVLAQNGAAVVVASRTASEIEKAARRIRERGGQAAAVAADVSDWQQARRLAEETERIFGPATILVANAGIVQPFGLVWDTPPEDWAASIDVNLTGAYFTARAFLPSMVARRKGALILVSSGAASRPMLGLSAYSAAKAGLNHFARSLTAELAEKDIPLRVFIFQPGVVDTRMQESIRASEPGVFPAVERYRAYHDTGALRDPREPAHVIYWLATPAAADLHGQVVSIDDPAIRERVAADLGIAPFKGR